MTDNRKENPQSILSKQLLSQALSSLMMEKAYQEINITELTKRADLSRRTFYRHFNTIEDVLYFFLQQISDDFKTFLSQQSPIDIKSVIYVYFSYWENKKDFLIILKENNLLFLLFQKLLPETSGKASSIGMDSEILDFASYFTSGGIWSMLIKWLDTDTPYSPDEMSDIAIKIIEHLSSPITNEDFTV